MLKNSGRNTNSEDPDQTAPVFSSIFINFLCNFGQLQAPESFYRCLQDMLKITDLLTMSKFVWALNDIGKQNSSIK